MNRIRPAAAFGFDVLTVIVFVAVGRRSHDESGNAIVGALKVAAPFLLALAAGWLIGRAWRAPLTYPIGAGVWLSTVAFGLALRRSLFHRGIATAFVIVTAVTLAVLMLGWRLAANRIAGHRRTTTGETGEPARKETKGS